MKWKLAGVLTLCVITILSVVLVSGRRSQAQVTVNTAASYKVEHVGDRGKNLEQRLNDEAQKGWRVKRIVVDEARSWK